MNHWPRGPLNKYWNLMHSMNRWRYSLNLKTNFACCYFHSVLECMWERERESISCVFLCIPKWYQTSLLILMFVRSLYAHKVPVSYLQSILLLLLLLYSHFDFRFGLFHFNKLCTFFGITVIKLFYFYLMRESWIVYSMMNMCSGS